MKWILFIMLLLPSSSYGSDKWDSTDKELAVAFSVLLFADYLQTRQIVSEPDKYYEGNPILGSHPNQQVVDIYSIAVLTISLLVVDILPSKWRKIWLSSLIAIESGTIVYNYKIGIRF